MTLVRFLVNPHTQDAAQKVFDAIVGVTEGVSTKSYPHPHYGRPGKRGGSTSRAAYAELEKDGRHWTPKRRVGKDKPKPPKTFDESGLSPEARGVLDVLRMRKDSDLPRLIGPSTGVEDSQTNSAENGLRKAYKELLDAGLITEKPSINRQSVYQLVDGNELPEPTPVKKPTPKKRKTKRDVTAKQKKVASPVTEAKPTVKTAADVRNRVLSESASYVSKMRDLEQKKDALYEEYKAIEPPNMLRFKDYNQYVDAHNEYAKKVNVVGAKQKEVRTELANLKNELSLKIRPNLYVEDPITVNYEVTRKFSSNAKKKSVEDAIIEFSKMVGVPISSSNVDVSAAGKQRAHYQAGSKAIKIGPNDGARIVVHELGHWLEDVSPEIHRKAVEFLERRTAGDTVKNLRRLTGMRYRSNEVTKPDKFIDPYIGKNYVRGGDRYATEVISMGLEYMHSEPWKLASEDPEMFDFIYNTVRGQ